ncbi:MAG: aminotransferase class I/II-fold pyridoxal phosphate-dependent enzyme [Halobacteriales archaeon]|nr:aminotransferase class I/II-fold pyridoxal phosphate-dependent enzyme [Halobacteriales archaeon]
MALAAFELERWLRRHQGDAKFPIGGSGVPQASLAPFLPGSAEDWERAWRTRADDATRGVQDAVARAHGVAAAEVVPTQGATEADVVAILGLAGSGAHVLVEEPAYFALLEPARAIGGRVTRIPRGPAQGFRLDPGAVARALTRDTKLVLTAQPHNPSGARSPDRDLVEMAEACAEVGAWLLTDEVFADATGPAKPARLLHDRIVTTSSLTKCLGFGPVHIGWVLADRDATEALDRAKSHLTATNPVLELVLAARILAERERLLAELPARRLANLRLVEQFAVRHGLRWHRPEAGTTCVVALRTPDDVSFANAALQREGVLVAPGSFIELPGWVRIGLAGPTATLQAGLEALGRVL